MERVNEVLAVQKQQWSRRRRGWWSNAVKFGSGVGMVFEEDVALNHCLRIS
jgi:hypothetical protein